MTDNQSIGVFDSGMGGLTVLRALRQALPDERFTYLGDTARLPYGTKSASTVTHYALQAARALRVGDIKLLVVACNTASAVALPDLAKALAPLPVIGVVEPGAAAGVEATRNGHIGVLATESTVRGGAYPRAIEALSPQARVTQVACPLFVALAEEGWTDGPIAAATAARYLAPLFEGPAADRPDTLVLGCTHFPVMRPAIAAVAGPGVAIVDSAETTAAAVRRHVRTHEGAAGAAGSKGAPPRFLVTDSPERFARVGSLFLGEPLNLAAVTLVDLTP